MPLNTLTIVEPQVHYIFYQSLISLCPSIDLQQSSLKWITCSIKTLYHYAPQYTYSIGVSSGFHVLSITYIIMPLNTLTIVEPQVDYMFYQTLIYAPHLHLQQWSLKWITCSIKNLYHYAPHLHLMACLLNRNHIIIYTNISMTYNINHKTEVCFITIRHFILSLTSKDI